MGDMEYTEQAEMEMYAQLYEDTCHRDTLFVGEWRTQKGELRKIRDMHTFHILNCIGLLNRCPNKKRYFDTKIKEFEAELRHRKGTERFRLIFSTLDNSKYVVMAALTVGFKGHTYNMNGNRLEVFVDRKYINKNHRRLVEMADFFGLDFTIKG